MLAESRSYFTQAADALDLPARVREILLTPQRVLRVEIVTESDSGELLHHLGYRVQADRYFERPFCAGGCGA